jgi:nucleolar GTP-binding protein
LVVVWLNLQVANYPFTTRGITMGHIYVEGITYQVRATNLSLAIRRQALIGYHELLAQIADTPGLLYRPDAHRNAIEKLALSMMEKTQAVGVAVARAVHKGMALTFC